MSTLKSYQKPEWLENDFLRPVLFGRSCVFESCDLEMGPTDIGINLLDDLANLGDEAFTHWQAIVDGNDEPIDASGRAVDGRGYPRAAITPADGEDDPEHPDSRSLFVALSVYSHTLQRSSIPAYATTSENNSKQSRITALLDA